jgi:uncharacterized protein (DUF2384 family)
MTTSPLRDAKREAFNRVLGASPDAVEEAVLHDRLVGESSLEAVTGNLAKLLAVGKLEVLKVLGVSRSRKSRNPTMNVELLDRAYSALDIYARVADVIGQEQASEWFHAPKRALAGARPVELLETRVGLRKLGSMVMALEDGSYL